MLGDLFEQLGAAIGTLDAQLRGLGGNRRRPREVAIYDPDTGDVHDLDDDTRDTLESAALAAAGTWLLARLLTPKDVSWPRVIFAGVAATAFADIVGRGGTEEVEPGELPYAEDPEELMSRLGAGIAVAAGYAALVYPRLPGPPLLRGLAFGALEVAAAPSGGLVRLASEVPGIRFPLQSLALPVDEDAGPASHLAFGLALGLLYRYDPD